MNILPDRQAEKYCSLGYTLYITPEDCLFAKHNIHVTQSYETRIPSSLPPSLIIYSSFTLPILFPSSQGRGGRGRGGASVEQYYKHSMVIDPWKTLASQSQQNTTT